MDYFVINPALIWDNFETVYQALFSPPGVEIKTTAIGFYRDIILIFKSLHVISKLFGPQCSR